MQSKCSIFLLSLILASCVGGSSDVERATPSRVDTLESIKVNLEREINSYFEEIERIEQNLNEIEALERVISIQSTGENISNNVSENINRKIGLIAQILQENEHRIDSLQRSLSVSSIEISGLNKMVARLTEKVKEQTLNVENLQKELLKRDALIEQRDVTIKGLANDIEHLEQENAQKNDTIKQQEQELFTAYYAFGTYKELKKQGILASNGLFSSPKVLSKDFNKSYFIKIDIRSVVEIPLYSRKVKVHTSHTKESYELRKSNDGVVLRILNPKEFWDVSNYLVIEVE